MLHPIEMRHRRRRLQAAKCSRAYLLVLPPNWGFFAKTTDTPIKSSGFDCAIRWHVEFHVTYGKISLLPKSYLFLPIFFLLSGRFWATCRCKIFFSGRDRKIHPGHIFETLFLVKTACRSDLPLYRGEALGGVGTPVASARVLLTMLVSIHVVSAVAHSLGSARASSDARSAISDLFSITELYSQTNVL